MTIENEENCFRLDDAADDGAGADARGVSAGGGAELSADTAVWAHREDNGTDGGEYPKGLVATGVGIGSGHVSE